MLEETSISTYLDEDHNQSLTTNISQLKQSATEHKQEAGSDLRLQALQLPQHNQSATEECGEPLSAAILTVNDRAQNEQCCNGTWTPEQPVGTFNFGPAAIYGANYGFQKKAADHSFSKDGKPPSSSRTQIPQLQIQGKGTAQSGKKRKENGKSWKMFI